MRFVIAAGLAAASIGIGSALAEETSLGIYGNWEATTFPLSDGSVSCSADSLAANHPQSAGAWVFVWPGFLQFAPSQGLAADAEGSVGVDGGTRFDLVVQDQSGFVADEEDLPLLVALANGDTLTIEVRSSADPGGTEYVYALDGFRDAYQAIADECGFDPSPVLAAAMPDPAAPATDDTVAPETEEGSQPSRSRK